MAVMTIQRLLLAMSIATHFLGANGEMEFGRERIRDGGVQRKRIHGGVGAIAASKTMLRFDEK